jgi:2-desacetyl-2-hydroxyethyl bacteriochlorophyllide A dehydrogenase
MYVNMKAARLIEPHKIAVMEIPTPVPDYDDVLIKVKYVGICGTDYSIYTGESSFVKDGMVRFPLTMGHEWSGVVEKTGRNVRNLKPGDRVTGDGTVTCGVCEACICGNYNLCKDLKGVGTIKTWDGAYAEYILLPERSVYKIPDGVSLQEAALVEPSATALYAVKRGGVKLNDSVLVIGTGPIGLAALHLSKLSGASCTVLAGRKDAKLDVGKKMGADYTVNILKENLAERISEITSGKGVNVVIEASGSVEMLQQSFALVRNGSTIAVVAFYDRFLDHIPIDHFVNNDIRLTGVAGSPRMSTTILELMGSGKVDFKPLITDIYKLDDVEKALKAMKEKNNTVVKILLEVD